MPLMISPRRQYDRECADELNTIMPSAYQGFDSEHDVWEVDPDCEVGIQRLNAAYAEIMGKTGR